MIYQIRNKANPKDTGIFSLIFISYSIYLRFAIPISHDFNTFIMSEEGNLPVTLSHATSIDTIWDFEIQGIENPASLPLTKEHSVDGGSPSMSALSSAPSGLLTPTLVKKIT